MFKEELLFLPEVRGDAKRLPRIQVCVLRACQIQHAEDGTNLIIAWPNTFRNGTADNDLLIFIVSHRLTDVQ